MLVERHVGYWPKADMPMRACNVRFWGWRGLPPRPGECLQMTKSGRDALSNLGEVTVSTQTIFETRGSRSAID